MPVAFKGSHAQLQGAPKTRLCVSCNSFVGAITKDHDEACSV